MNTKYMYCPVHKDLCLETKQNIVFHGPPEKRLPIFWCEYCKRYYYNPQNNSVKGYKETTGKSKTGHSIFKTDSRVFSEDPVPKAKKAAKSEFKLPESIWEKPAVPNLSKEVKNSPSPTNTKSEIRIHLFEKSDTEKLPRLMASLAHLCVEYPPLGTFSDFNDFIRKVFPSNIDQTCVVRNQTYVGTYGYPIRRVEIYNKKSGFLKKALPSNTYIAFGGRLNAGELVIDEMRVIQDPVLKSDDKEGTFTFFFDGPNHQNVLWNFTESVAQQPEELKGELADWSSYLDWKRQLAEMKIQGIKYIGIRFEIEERQMYILAVTDGEEEYKKFRKALRRNEVSAFSNIYSTDQWKFSFNNNDGDYKNESGVDLLFLGDETGYQKSGIGSNWDSLRSSFRKYSNQKELRDINYCLKGISENYVAPYFVELRFELSNSAMDLIERSIKRTGTLPRNIEDTLADEFYGDGYLATSQIGDFALLKRLKIAVLNLARGKAASPGLDAWLFDITKARLPKDLVVVDHWQNENINERQKRAVEKILSAPDVCLIQGPPGTGKTTVIAEAIYQTVIRNKRVLVASQANLAVDNALERLIANPKIRAIRLGNAKKIDSSVNNITEANVLESFYGSIVKYIDDTYLTKWKKYDEIIAECDYDYKAVENLESHINQINANINALEIKLTSKASSWNPDEEYRCLKERKMEKINLSMIKAFVSGKSEELDVALSKDSIIAIWNIVAPSVLEAQKDGIWLTRVGIDTSDLDGFIRINQANDILKHVITNVKRALKLKEKLAEEVQFGGDSSVLEALRIKEQALREKFLKDMSSETMLEWKSVNDEIDQIVKAGGGLTEAEGMLFGQSGSEPVKDRSKMLETLSAAEYLLLRINELVLEIADKLINSILEAETTFAEREGAYEAETKKFKSTLNDLQDQLKEANRSIQIILDKYGADRDVFEERIAEKKESVSDDTGIDRDEWEDIFSQFKDWVADIPDYAQEKDLFLKTFINGCNVVGVSCTENARTLNEAGFDDFDLVIIDEVSKATPPELLIPMLRGRKIVLVGDHRQLPPLFNEHEKTYQEVAEQQELLKEDRLENVAQLTMDDFNKYKDMVTASLFQRYFEHASEDIKETLTYQYRMHKDIMEIVNQFYDGYLHDGNEGKYEHGCKSHGLSIATTNGTAMIIPERHAYWFDSSYLDGYPIYEHRKPGSTSAENILEAYAIVELLKKMELNYANQRIGMPPVSVGVISFYYDQVSTLRSMIKKESFHAIDVEINTVDRFQGKEKEVIIVSLVRNVKNARHKVDSHIAAFQRINVAFSRAQNLLIIMGAKDMYAPQPVAMTDMNNGEEKEVLIYKKIIEMLDLEGSLFNCEDIIPESVADEIFETISRKGDVDT